MFWGPGDWVSTLLWFIFLIIFLWLGPRMMLFQVLNVLEKEANEMEMLAKKAEEKVSFAILRKKDKKVRQKVSEFLDFFSIYPVDLDPAGIIRKLDHLVKNSEEKVKSFLLNLNPKITKTQEKDLKAALSGAITARQIAKIVRHYVEIVKKYKMLQLALILQMQLPLIKNLLKASVKATEAFINEIPIGDSIGPLVAAKLMKGKAKKFEKEEFIVVETKIAGKKVFVAKALGPGATTGYPGKFLKKFIKRNKITRIITVDAALKLEGEATGSIAEGVGVAMGGIGVERYEIEEIAVEHGIMLDAIAIKQSHEEALQPMKKEILMSANKVVEKIEEIIRLANKNEKILIIGVGNTCGVGNSPEEAKKAEKKLKNFYKKEEENHSFED
ncbi:MAG TPA: DUF1512 domain-containing protein [Nanoarchaeota archaeon]|nr:DUF1512 domain-containing protein [Nanoarchaeota archaeon]